MSGKAKYQPGMRLGSYECPDGQIGILFLERIDKRWGMFECPYCNEPFRSLIGAIVNGTAHACKKHARFPYVDGQRIGDFINPDGSTGMIFVQRIYDDDGKPTSYGEFICPIDGKHFNAEVLSVAKGITRTSPKYAHTKYSPGMMLGNYIDRNTGEPYSVKFVKRVSEYRGVFECHYCHEHYETEIRNVIDGTASQCQRCYHTSTRKYNDGDYVGEFEYENTIGTKLIKRIDYSYGLFECPICHEEYRAEYRSVANGERPICTNCKREFRYQELQKTDYDGFVINTRRSYGPNTRITVLTGKRFGHLTALYPLDGYTQGNFVVWKCRCDCGNLCTRTSEMLLHSTENTSCGCVAHKNHGRIIARNYSGRTYGNITILEKIGFIKGKARYRCKCECENPCDNQLFTYSAIDRIISGEVIAKPGCQKSIGEARIEKILRELHIRHKTQASFETLINPKTGKKLFCDFYLPDYKMVIEFDGRQHYQEGSQWGR